MAKSEMAENIRDVSTAGYIVRIVQTVMSLVLLIVAALETALDASEYAYSLTLFSSLWTLAVLIYMTVSVHAWQRIYSFSGILTLECITIGFWIASLGCLSAQGHYKMFREGNDGSYSPLTDLIILAISLSGLMILLHLATLWMLAIRAHRFGGHAHHKNQPTKEARGSASTASHTEADVEKV